MTKSITHLLGSHDPTDHATPSNVRLGREIYESDEVEIVESSSTEVVAKVGGGQTRTASFEVTGGDLQWHCACRRDKPPWCKHLVALSLVVARR